MALSGEVILPWTLLRPMAFVIIAHGGIYFKKLVRVEIDP